MLENASRRTFVKGAALSAIGIGAINTAMLSSSAMADESSESEWTQSADVVVVGLGGAGATAAVAALEAGASVCVLERNTRGGGSTLISGGYLYMGGGTQIQKRFGIEDTPEAMLAYVKEAAGPSADSDNVEYFCKNSVDLCDWCIAHGMQFEGDIDLEGYAIGDHTGICLNYSGNERNAKYAAIAKPAPRGHTPVNGGYGIFEPFETIVNEQATVLYETRGLSLITDDSGEVRGVLAEDSEGNQVAIKAHKGVVLTCGAFTYNEELLENIDPLALRPRSRTGIPYDLADGIIMGSRIGAALKNMYPVNMQHFIYRYGDLTCGVLVDANGMRFVAEDSYGTWIGRGIEKHTPDACWVITDGIMKENVIDRLGYYDYQPSAEADTIEELAEAIGIEPNSLTATIDRYNSLAEMGEDVDCGKDPKYLMPIQTAPFCAYDCSVDVCSYHTLGGLKINVNAEVIDLDGNVIPRLYAAGRTSCGIFGEYPGSGSSIADSLTFGRVAGTQAASLSSID